MATMLPFVVPYMGAVISEGHAGDFAGPGVREAIETALWIYIQNPECYNLLSH